MVKDLRTLLQETAQVPPEERRDLGALVDAGRRRLRRRRGVTALAAASAVVCVAGASALAGGLLDTGTTAGPASGTGPVGPVVHLEEARPAVEGRDHDVVTTFVNDNLDRANGVHFEEVTEDGLIVLRDGPHGIENRLRWGLLDPATDEPRWLPAPQGGRLPEHLLDARADRLVFTSQSGDGGFSLWVFDRTARTWQETEVDGSTTGMGPDVMGPWLGSATLGPEDRVYFAVDGDALEVFHLWSVALDDPTDLREEATVGDWALQGDELTFTEHTNRPSTMIHVRDLGTGEERVFDARSGSSCNSLGMRRAGDLIVLAQFCGEDASGRDDRVQVVTTDGTPVVTLQDDGIDLAAVTDRLVSVRSYVPGASGAYAYDLESGELLRLGQGHVKFAGSSTGRGDLLTWTTPVNRGHGMKIWAATFD